MLRALKTGIKASSFSKILEDALRKAKIGGTISVEGKKDTPKTLIITISVIPDGKALWRDVAGNLITGSKTELADALEELTGLDVLEIVFKYVESNGAIFSEIHLEGGNAKALKLW